MRRVGVQVVAVWLVMWLAMSGVHGYLLHPTSAAAATLHPQQPHWFSKKKEISSLAIAMPGLRTSMQLRHNHHHHHHNNSTQTASASTTTLSFNSVWRDPNLLFKLPKDRVTLLGVAVNIALSVAKFLGGIAFNSAVLVADAGHSLSDLFSDFITLWAVQVARIPADKDHPYGHGKFESIGSLFLALTLIATGLSVGTWSYGKMLKVILNGIHENAVKIPSWPALGLALMSIVSKEWLYRVTKRVGENLNSQILIANAWHHRSDAFSSIMSLFSIAAAIYLPGLLIADSAAGILIAGMICITGIEVLVESVKQLTDSSDDQVVQEVIQVVKDKVDGVRGIKNVRARNVGSGSLVDMTIFTDMKLSTSAAHAIAEQARWKVIETLPNVIDVLVRTQAVDTVLCPLLSKDQRSIQQMEEDIRKIIADFDEGRIVREVKRVTVHYVRANAVNVEIVLSFDPTLSLEEIKSKANMIKYALLQKEQEIIHTEIQLDLGGDSSMESHMQYAQ